MNPPTQSDVSGMADLLKAMGSGDDLFDVEGAPSTPPPVAMPSFFRAGDIDPISGLPIEADAFTYDDVSPEIANTVPVHRAPRVPVSSDENSHMANILRAFVESGGEQLARAVDDGVQQTSMILMEDSEAMPDLKRAMATQRTANGVRVGGWQIIAEGEKNSARYHVVSVESNQQIAKNLYLYEAAKALVNYLNEGLMINNMKVQSILGMEMEYAKHIEDAIQHKHACSRAIDRGDDARLEVSKIRFNESKTKAVAARHKLVEHLGKQ